MKKLKEMIDAQRQKSRFEQEADLKASFRVVERGGFLWLTHGNVAFMKVADLAQTSDIIIELNKARECAVEFERL